MLERGNLIDTGRTNGRRGLRAAILVAAAAAMTGAVILLPASLSDRIIESDLRNAAHDWRQRVVGQLSKGPETFALSSLTLADREVLELISQTSEIQQIDLIDTEGRIFWATRDELIGQHQKVSQVGTAASPDHVNYAVRFVDPDPDSIPFGAVAGSPRAVAEIEVPVTEARGGVVGWLELHHDITLIRATSILRIRLALIAGSVLAFGALLGALALLRSSRNRTLEADARARQLKVVMAEQIRLTREVHLLGQINEWPGSTRSQGELFQAVARFMEHVLPSWSGSLYVLSVSGDVLDGVVSWNGGTHLGHLRAADFTLISQGRACASDVTNAPSSEPELQAGRASLCIPIRAQGETVGLLNLAAEGELDEATLATQRRVAQAGADQISMAIANARMRDALQQQAIRDPLTGLFNRRHLLETVRRALDMRLYREASVLAIAVDQLDRLNEEHGHDAGDMILRAVAGVLRRHAEGDAIAARAGGAELTLVLPKVGEAEAMNQAEQIRKELAALAMRLGPVTLQGVVVSVGVAQLPHHGIRPVEAIRAASDALHAARAHGGDRVMAAASGTGEAAAWTMDHLADNTATLSVGAPRLIA
ncbi:GGDEF domain-containing protein [Rubellimicrobium rubrum]|uniref:diguanylate cyclase n=1 Tax=Rubellimicrobium rubrum TaxID=2585369 RepID=A0A5C4N5P7_9RHOB|nr:sensor domain-containing diguanylate cyclase [Rubellimicrobium rubrum]TNC52978.1 GGDEF domain-containing protein [Rubellimicrobium rubrum]